MVIRFPVPTRVYDETIKTLQSAVKKSKLGRADKSQAIKKLYEIAANAEKDFVPNDNFEKLIEKEREDSWKYGGKTVFGDVKPPGRIYKGIQLRLF